MSQESWSTEFYGLPEFVVDCHQTEETSVGMRIYHWRKLGNVLVPQFTAVLSTANLLMISRDIQEVTMRAMREAPAKGMAIWAGNRPH